MKIFLFLAFVALSGSLAWTQQSNADPCDDPQTQLEMNQCACQRYRDADARLNEVYKEFMAKASKGDQELVRTAQRTWIKFRDQHCEFHEKFYEGGSMALLARCGCLRATTEQRVKEIEGMIDYYEF